MVACSPILLWIALIGTGVEPAGMGTPARSFEVVVRRLEVFNEPDDQGFATTHLDRGEKVVVRKTLGGGWLAIAPPEGSFHWVDDTTVERLRDGRFYVKAATTRLRLGHEGSPRPGPLKTTMTEGAVLIAANQPLLSYTEGRRSKIWRAVVVDADEVRFIRSAGVLDPSRSDSPPESSPERKVSHVVAEPVELPPDLAGPLHRIEGDHRSIIVRPIEQWNLASVRKDYQTLQANHTDSASRSVIDERLGEVERENGLAKAAADFEALIKKSRRRDALVTQIKERVRDIRDAEELAFDAEGLLQATSRQVDGEKVYSLLNDEGQVVTYLRVPPGIDTTNLTATQVGVRGKSRFNDTLRYRLLDVRDIEPLR